MSNGIARKSYYAPDEAAEDWIKVPASLSEWFESPLDNISSSHSQRPRRVLNSCLQLLEAKIAAVPNAPEQATTMAQQLVNDLWQALCNRGSAFRVPTISAFEDGAIDMFWNSAATKILLHISPEGVADFSAKTSTLKVSGNPISDLNMLADFLAR